MPARGAKKRETKSNCVLAERAVTMIPRASTSCQAGEVRGKSPDVFRGNLHQVIELVLLDATAETANTSISPAGGEQAVAGVVGKSSSISRPLRVAVSSPLLVWKRIG